MRGDGKRRARGPRKQDARREIEAAKDDPAGEACWVCGEFGCRPTAAEEIALRLLLATGRDKVEAMTIARGWLLGRA